MEFVFRATHDVGMDFGETNRAHFKQWLKDNPGTLCKITPILPESNKQRRYLEGAVIPLVTYYQDDLNHRDSGDRAKVREWLKLEFNSERVGVSGGLPVATMSTISPNPHAAEMPSISS